MSGPGLVSGRRRRGRLTGLDDAVDVHALLARHVADDGEDGDAGVDTREETHQVDHDRVPATREVTV